MPPVRAKLSPPVAVPPPGGAVTFHPADLLSSIFLIIFEIQFIPAAVTLIFIAPGHTHI